MGDVPPPTPTREGTDRSLRQLPRGGGAQVESVEAETCVSGGI